VVRKCISFYSYYRPLWL